MAKPIENPWAGRRVIADPGMDHLWTFAPDGRTVELDTGTERAVLPLRPAKGGWRAHSQPVSFLFRRDGMWMQLWLGRVHVETRRMVDAPPACP